MRKLALICVISTLITGACAPSQQEIATADIGSYPENYEDQIRGYLRAHLKDPDSLRDFFASRPVRGLVPIGLVYGGPVPAYVSCVQFNAKNSFGGYAGKSNYFYFFKNGSLIGHIDGDPWRDLKARPCVWPAFAS